MAVPPATLDDVHVVIPESRALAALPFFRQLLPSVLPHALPALQAASPRQVIGVVSAHLANAFAPTVWRGAILHEVPLFAT